VANEFVVDIEERLRTLSSQLVEGLDITPTDKFKLLRGDTDCYPLRARDGEPDGFLQDFILVDKWVKVFLPYVILQAAAINIGNGLRGRTGRQHTLPVIEDVTIQLITTKIDLPAPFGERQLAAFFSGHVLVLDVGRLVLWPLYNAINDLIKQSRAASSFGKH